jgi:hypothetical protein
MTIVIAESTQLLNSTGLNQLIGSVMSNPKVAAAVIIQIILGFGLGYIMAKAFKYIIGFIIILFAGAVLNVWSIGSSLQGIYTNTTLIKEYSKYAMSFLKLLGILMVGPVTLGFFLGLIVGWLRK